MCVCVLFVVCDQHRHNTDTGGSDREGTNHNTDVFSIKQRVCCLKQVFFSNDAFFPLNLHNKVAAALNS